MITKKLCVRHYKEGCYSAVTVCPNNPPKISLCGVITPRQVLGLKKALKSFLNPTFVTQEHVFVQFLAYISRVFLYWCTIISYVLIPYPIFTEHIIEKKVILYWRCLKLLPLNFTKNLDLNRSRGGLNVLSRSLLVHTFNYVQRHISHQSRENKSIKLVQ